MLKHNTPFLFGSAKMPQPGQRDFGRKASFVTEIVQWYDESSTNGGRIKTIDS